MAARLMMNYPSIVSCDEETYKAAITKLNKQDFESLPSKPLKGIADPGVIREYNKDHEYELFTCYIRPYYTRKFATPTLIDVM